MKMIVPVKVRYSIDSYKARIFKVSASCTSDAETAVKRVVEKYQLRDRQWPDGAVQTRTRRELERDCGFPHRRAFWNSGIDVCASALSAIFQERKKACYQRAIPTQSSTHSTKGKTMNQFITVPETTLPNGTIVPSFQVGAFACSKSDDGKAIVVSDRAPWVRINYHEARQACIDAGFALITELQWLAIAHDVANQDSNWTGGKVGEGDLFQGLRNDTVEEGQAGDYVPADSSEQRWLTLSNGERICDLNGNVYQWIFDNVQGDENGIIASDFHSESPSITTPQYPSEEKGMGNYEVWDWSGNALVRGGYWGSESRAGVFNLNYDFPVDRLDDVGFRCTKPIGL